MKWVLIILGSLGFTLLLVDRISFITGPPPFLILFSGDPNNLDKIIKHLGYRKDAKIRESIIQGLVKIGEPAIKPLISALNSKEENVKVDAIEALGEIGDEAAVVPLITALEDEGEKVRKEAADALGKIGDPIAQEPLKNTLEDQKESVSKAAAIALYKLDAPRTIELLITVLEKGDRNERLETIIELGKLGDTRAIKPLIKAFNYFQDINDLMLIVDALRKFGSLAVEPLIDALNDRNYIVRFFSAQLLGDIGDTRAIEPLIKTLNDSYSQISGGFVDSPLISQKYKAFERRYPVRIEAELALENFDDPRAVAALSEYRNSSVQGAVKLGSEKPNSVESNKGMIENLYGLKVRVSALLDKHPPNPMASIPKAEDQIPWICRTLDEAAKALKTRIDPFGNSITEEQVKDGLSKLFAMVNNHEYLTLMEMKYPGISSPLENLMKDLQMLIEPTKKEATSSKGIEDLVKLWAPGNMFRPTSKEIKKIADEFNRDGEAGSKALADTMRDLLACRSPNISYAIRVAEHVNPTTELIESVRAVVEAPALITAPNDLRFEPEIIGSGKIGWTDGTHGSIVNLAQGSLSSLENRV